MKQVRRWWRFWRWALSGKAERDVAAAWTEARGWKTRCHKVESRNHIFEKQIIELGEKLKGLRDLLAEATAAVEQRQAASKQEYEEMEAGYIKTIAALIAASDGEIEVRQEHVSNVLIVHREENADGSQTYWVSQPH